MTEHIERIPFEVEVGRIIEVLAKQIYQSPLALLRENTQNAFDAILLRRHAQQAFEPRIDITITHDEISIEDNGIGMTPDDLRRHYWKAGSSGKNNPDAREAGVVGTFGIGAMANFGIADRLSLSTESAITGERTTSSADKVNLSTTEDCISLAPIEALGTPGTRVVAHIAAGNSVDVAQATAYISDFVGFVDVPVYVNGQLVSGRSTADAVPPVGETIFDTANRELIGGISADAELRVAGTGEVWTRMRNVHYQGQALVGELILRQGVNSLRTFRSGFGLATVGVNSAYQFGGAANFTSLEPTAGREALTTASMQLLQSLVSAADAFVSIELAARPEADANVHFMTWVTHHGRYDLCDNVTTRVEPGSTRVPLRTIREDSRAKPALAYTGNDPAIINAYATDDSRLIVLAAQNPRRQCETEYLRQFATVQYVQDTPAVLSERSRATWTTEEQALVYRVTSILSSDYFVNAVVTLGELSHGLPILAEPQSQPLKLVLDSRAATFNVVAELYRSDIAAFSSMVKDFVRNMIFPRIQDRVPSSTRQGAEAFLKTITRTRDVFEYEWTDLDSLSNIWNEYLEGRLSIDEAAERSSLFVQRNVQVVDVAAARQVSDVVPDVVANEQAVGADPLVGPAPPILRTDVSSDAKLLTIDPSGAPLKGFRCFIALSQRARDERGDFFLQPHATSVVWGGQKVLFVFEHHSGQFGLYYDLQTTHVVARESGGGPFPTATIVLRDRIYIPIPDEVAAAFVPAPEERKRFEVRCDLLYTEVP